MICASTLSEAPASRWEHSEKGEHLMQRTTASAVRLPVKSHDSQSGFWRQPEQVGNSLRNKAAARASFQMAELAATELTEKLNCETFPKDLAHHREELKSACKTLPEVIVGVLAAYRRKLEENPAHRAKALCRTRLLPLFPDNRYHVRPSLWRNARA